MAACFVFFILRCCKTYIKMSEANNICRFARTVTLSSSSIPPAHDPFLLFFPNCLSNCIPFCFSFALLSIPIFLPTVNIPFNFTIPFSQRQSSPYSMSASTERPIVETFFDILDHSEEIRNVDPRHCIPFVEVRDISRSGVERLKLEFLGLIEGSHGYIAGGSYPHLVVLEGALKIFVEDYFITEHEMTRERARRVYSSNDRWYGVVDGAHRIFALKELREDFEAWKSFRFTAVLITKAISIPQLRSLARALNRRQRADFNVASTFADRIVGLRREAAEIEKKSGKCPTNDQVAQQYLSFKTSKSLNTVKQEAQFSRNLHQDVVDAIVAVSGYEDPSIMLDAEREKDRILNAKSRGESAQMEPPPDARLHVSLFNLSNLRIKSLREAKTRVQTNVIWRAKERHEDTAYKPVSKKQMSQIVESCKAAVMEAEKFEAVNGPDWPEPMTQVKDNLLKSSLLDAEVSLNAGNNNQLIPTIVSTLKASCPSVYATVMRDIWRSGAITETLSVPSQRTPPQLDSGTGTRQNENPSVPLASGCSAHHVLDRAESCAGDLCSARSVQASDEARRSALLQLDCRVYQMTWQDFSTTSPSYHSILRGRVDLILTDPSYNVPFVRGEVQYPEISTEEMKAFCEHSSRVLKPGGVIHIFTVLQQVVGWERCLHDCGFAMSKTLEHYIRNALQVYHTTGQKQNVVDYGIVAFRKGKRHFFNPIPRYTLVDSSHARRENVIDNIESNFIRVTTGAVEGKKGSGRNVRQGEKNENMLSEIIVTYCPDGGLVYDPYAGTMSTAMAAMQVGRKCVCIEKDAVCFKLSLPRLERRALSIVGTRAKGGNECSSHSDLDSEKSRGRTEEQYGQQSGRSIQDSSPMKKRKMSAVGLGGIQSSSAEGISSWGDEEDADESHCCAVNCLMPEVPLPEYPTICFGTTNNARCISRIHDLCDYAKQNQTPEQEQSGTFDGKGFCSRRCFETWKL